MCVKLSPRDLNLGLCPSHLINTYTCGVTIYSRVHDVCVCIYTYPRKFKCNLKKKILQNS